jgi:type I restriction enzyme M protein
MQTRTLRVLTDGHFVDGDLPPTSDIGRIVYAYRQWRGEQAPEWWGAKVHGEWKYRDAPGFCRATTTGEIEKHGFVLTPGRFVGAEEQDGDGESFAEKFPRLLAELETQFRKGAELVKNIQKKLKGVDHGV